VTVTTTRVEEILTRYGDPQACVAALLCDYHPADAVAFTVLDADLTPTHLTYGELRERSERFAAALHALGVDPGDRVATLMGKGIDLAVAVVGTWRAGAVHVPLFTAFAANAVQARLEASGAKVVVCDATQRDKVGSGTVVVSGPSNGQDLALDALLAAHERGFPAVAVGADGPIVQIYTSGTTGAPKAVVMPVRGLAAVHAYMELGLDVRPDDVYWNAADPGWAYGHYYGLLGPLCLGVTSTWLATGFDAALTWRVLAELGVTNFAAAPTVYRAMRQAPGAPVRLRCASSAGEPLTPEINQWAPEALGTVVRDHYGQTETGMLVNNHWAPGLLEDLRPGSMGRPMPGWSGTVLLDDRDEPAPVGTAGRIAFDLEQSPLAWFTGYLGAPEKSSEKLRGRWYLTGDAGTQDEDGTFRFLSRDDDVIIMAGYRIGPFDVESVLVTHPLVAEAAAVAAPDPLRGEVLEAYVVLTGEGEGSPELAAELQQLVKTGFAAHAFPRTVHFVPELPKTASGKVQRFVLRERRRTELESQQ
jgi:acetyl-CoA synthetase